MTASRLVEMAVSVPETSTLDKKLTSDIALHFKLSAVNETATESYEDAHCQYIPQLDPSRDKALMELLPEYLVEQISFPRPQAAKFYARVVKALTEKLEQ